jgi:hypothetical protein
MKKFLKSLAIIASAGILSTGQSATASGFDDYWIGKVDELSKKLPKAERPWYLKECGRSQWIIAYPLCRLVEHLADEAGYE